MADIEKRRRDVSDQQKNYVLGIFLYGNKTKAAIEAGYNPKYAAQNTDKLLKNTKVNEYYQKIKKEIEEKKLREIEKETIAKPIEVFKVLTEIIKGEKVKDHILFKLRTSEELTSEERVEEHEVTVSIKDRLTASNIFLSQYEKFMSKENEEEGRTGVVILPSLLAETTANSSECEDD